VKRIGRYTPLLFASALLVPFASAQSGFDLNIGFGSAQAPAASGFDAVTFNPCTPANDANCASTPSLSGFMLGFGGNLMLWKHFGVGAEVNFQTGKQNYLEITPQINSIGQAGETIQTRTTFYDFNGIYQPVKVKRAAVQLVGGIGGANVKFYDNVSSNSALFGNQNFSQYFQSSNHFQVHGGAGVQIYLTDHVFVRPQFDVHWVNNFVQFGRNVVTQETVWLGYSFGGQ
jgi:hypothetical protein